MATVETLEAALESRLQANKLKIPPYPAVAAKLEKLAREGGCSLNELANVVSADPSLAAAVLGRANSAAQQKVGKSRRCSTRCLGSGCLS